MIRSIMNILKIWGNIKNSILMILILPAIIALFSFEFGIGQSLKLGVIDKDDSYVSQEIINTIRSLEDVEVLTTSENDYKIDLVTGQVQMVIIIDENFQDNLINLKDDKIIIKSISESDIKEVVENMINLKIDDLITISELSNKDLNKFKELNTDYMDIPTQLSLKDITKNR